MPSAALARKGAQLPQFRSHSREESVSRRADVIPRRHSWHATAPSDPPRKGPGCRPLRSRSAPSRDAGEPVVRARLAALTDRCWQCRTKVRGIVGVLVDPAETPEATGFLPFDDVSEMLADRLDPRALAGRRIGRVAHRESPGVAGGYLANGCIECDALIGRFQLEDLLHEHLQAGGTYAQLDIGVPVELPAVALAHRLTAHA